MTYVLVAIELYIQRDGYIYSPCWIYMSTKRDL